MICLPQRMINFTFNSNRAESGSMTGLNDSEWGQIGVNNMQGTFGWTCNFRLPLDNINIKEQNNKLQYKVTSVHIFVTLDNDIKYHWFIDCTNTLLMPIFLYTSLFVSVLDWDLGV